MSAKGRKTQVPNDEEFFATPTWSIECFITSSLLKLPGGVWIEPCAGTGQIVKTVNEFRSDIQWRLFEIQEKFRPELELLHRPGIDTLEFGSFLHLCENWTGPRADVLIMNPPFSLTMQFILAAMKLAKWVVCLQRKGFFGTQVRGPWLRAYCPDDYTLWRRASFLSGGKTDSTEYSWFVWPPDPFHRTGTEERMRRIGQIAMLDPYPAEADDAINPLKRRPAKRRSKKI